LMWVTSPRDDMPEVGDAAPGFTLTSNEGTDVMLSDYQGQWVVLYFYPKDFTRGCTIQARRFQEDMDEFTARNAVILGVSVDDAESHAEFCAKEGLAFKLLADIDGTVSAAYGSLRGTGPAIISARNTFLIDPDGVVAKIWVGASPHSNSDEALAAIDSLSATG
ncbi:MAG: peroxiredoxin, partial [Rhodothermales bacterium]|nr:peroxiredoxin [Rhodothermales bacterium]